MKGLAALLIFLMVVALIPALMTLQGALVLWIVSLFVAFNWTWLQAFGAGLLLSLIGGAFRVRVKE